MSTQVSITKNAGILMGSELVVRAMDAVVAVLLARYLAPQGYGLMAFVLSFAWLFSMLLGFGMGPLNARDLARDPQHLNRYLSNGLVVKAALAILTLVVMGLVSMALGFPMHKHLMVLLAGLLVVLETNVWFALSFFEAAQRMGTVSLVSLGIRTAWLVVALGMMSLHSGLPELFVAQIVITGAGLVVAVRLIDRRLTRIAWSFDPAFAWRMLKASIPFACFAFFGAAYADLTMVVLSLMRGDVVTGWFAAATKVCRALAFIPDSVNVALLPALAQLSRKSPSDLLDTLARSCKYLSILALPIAGGICVLADQVVAWIFGPAYQASVPVLRVLIWAVPFTFVNGSLGAGLAAVNQERSIVTVQCVGALSNILGNVLLIPQFGHIGAAIATTCSLAVVFLFQVALLRRALPQLRVMRRAWKPLIATIGMMGFAWVSRGAGLLYTLLGSAALYVGGLIALRGVGGEEWVLLSGLFKRNVLGERA